MKKALLSISLVLMAMNLFANGQQETASDENKSIEIVTWDTKAPTPFSESMDARFKELYPGIELVTQLKEGDPGNEWFSYMAKGEAPDVITMSATKYDQYYKAGLLQNITELGEVADMDKFDKNFVATLRRDGDLYCIPNANLPMLFGYNKRLLKEAGFDQPPATWEEMVEYASVLNNPDEGVAGYGMLSSQWTEWWFQFYVWQAGGDLTRKNDDDTITLTFDDPAVIKAAELYQQLVREDLIQSDVTTPFGGMISLFAAGKVAMMPFACDWVNWAVSEGMPKKDLGLALYPAGPSGSREASIAGNVWIINPSISREKKEAALKYIEWRTSQEYQTALFTDMYQRDALNPQPMIRSDVKLSEIGDIPEEYASVLSASLVENRSGEFYGKGEFGSYVDSAIQQIIANPEMDALTVFTEAQEYAIAEGAVAEFNENILK